MKGKVCVQSQEEFSTWLDAMKVAFGLTETDNQVSQSPDSFPCVVVFDIVSPNIEVSYINESDFIK